MTFVILFIKYYKKISLTTKYVMNDKRFDYSIVE